MPDPNTQRLAPNAQRPTPSAFAWLTRGSVLLLLLLAGWGAGSTLRGRRVQEWPSGPKKLRVLTTIFPIYDFARTIGGEDVEVRNLLPAGVDPHEFALSPQDVKLAAGADIIFANGAGLDDFIGTALREAGVSRAPVIRLTDGIPLIQSNGDPDHPTGDPHAWLDPNIAGSYSQRIADALAEREEPISSAAAIRIRRRGIALNQAISGLCSDYAAGTQNLRSRSFIAFHGAFAYLARAYNLDVAAVWEKSPGRDPSPKEVADLLRIAREKNIRALFAEPQFSPRAIEMIATDARIPVYTLDPVETAEDFQNTHYVEVMRKNLQTLRKALGRGR